jgi:hypothetical protein
MANFLRPNYGNGCFADLPALIRHCLTGESVDLPAAAQWGDYLRRYDTVVLVLVDAFGWRFFERYADESPFLQHFIRHGKVLRWTSQFPSTTTAHITCLNTGLTPGQSGLFEWQFYEPALDAVIEPLTYTFAGEQNPETLRQAGVDPALIYPSPTYPQALRQAGTQPIVYQPREFNSTTYSTWMLRNAEVRGYRTVPEGAVNLRHEITEGQPGQPRYFFFYAGSVDTIGHYDGPLSPQFEAEAETVLFVLQRALLEPLLHSATNTLLIFTADHGMVETDPQTTLYLNTNPLFAGIERLLRRDRKGKLLSPGGSARDVFLHINDGLVEEAQAFLAERLAGKAEVVTTRSLVEQGYFGPPPFAPQFLARLGDLVILPYAGESVWWYEKDRFEQKFYGHHGGLTPQEMKIPVGLLPLDVD